MPEGPEIRIVSEELNSIFQNRICVKIVSNSVFTDNLFKSDYCFINKIFNVNRICDEIYSIGKKIFFIFQNKCFISSCLMNGRWLLNEPERYLFYIQFENLNLYYSDYSQSSHFSILSINSSNYISCIKDLGPDYFYVVFEDFKNQIKRRKLDVQDFLMNQSIFSGVGNYLKSDILFMAKIHPKTSVKDLSDHEIETLFHCIKNRMENSYLCGGSSFYSYCSPSGKLGTYQHLIYGKKGNNILTTNDKNGRITYYSKNIS